MNTRYGAKAGFSLIEIVIVLFLAGIMLYCVAGLTDRTFKTMKFLQEKSSTLESASLACQRLGAEMREMVEDPTLGASSVEFSKVIPQSALTVANVPADDPTTWSRTYPAGQKATVTYSMSPGSAKVVRQVNSEPSIDVATDVNTFQVTELNHPGNYLIKLTMLEDRRAVTFETIVICPGVPR